MEFLEELHGYELEALRVFADFCEQHGLTYFAIGGTLLGAVRHQGFIPWDDDVDVAMPRDDYDRLLSLAEEFPKPFVLEDFHRTKGFKSYFAKIRSEDIELLEELTDNAADRRVGYLIDILPIDGTPNDVLVREGYYMKAMALRFLCGAANVNTGIRTSRPKKEQALLKVCRALRLYRFLRVERIYRAMDALFHRQEVRNSQWIGTLTGAYKLKEIVPASLFGLEETPVYLPFEDMRVRVPRQYRRYLYHMFGDYRVLPPQRERKVHYQGTIRKKR